MVNERQIETVGNYGVWDIFEDVPAVSERCMEGKWTLFNIPRSSFSSKLQFYCLYKGIVVSCEKDGNYY